MVRKLLMVSGITSLTLYSTEIHQHTVLLNTTILQLGQCLQDQRSTLIQLQSNLKNLPFTEFSATERARITDMQNLIKLALQFTPKETSAKKALLEKYDAAFLSKLANVIQPARQTPESIPPLPTGPLPKIPEPQTQEAPAQTSALWKLLGY